MINFFTSDLHFGHANVIGYSNRPFKNVEEMNETLIRNWNNRVKPEDTVFHAGDFCFKNSPGGKAGEGLILKAKDYIQKLNGNIIFIRGNHDKNNSLKTIIQSCTVQIAGMFIYINHYPDKYNPNADLNFCGHVHDKWKFKSIPHPNMGKNKLTLDIINIGCDQWGYMPRTFEEIYHAYRIWKKSQS